MANNTSLNLVDLDYDLTLNSLKTFMQGQSQFRDYDFDGSSLNVLLSVLAYNTQKNIFFLNMNVAESFLDSAQLRDSILSHAKALNYTPRSARSAKATVTVTFEATTESQPYIIPKGSSFSTLIKANSFIFSIGETLVLSSANNSYSFTTDIYEGIYLKDTYVFVGDTENQRFRISNPTVDTESLTVQVYEDQSVVGDTYVLAHSLLDLTGNSKVYFLQASEKGFYEVVFGNGVIGKKPKNNSTVILNYRVSSAGASNGAKVFVLNFDPTGASSELTSDPVITTDVVAFGGAPPESNESIRYIAPRHFQVQERAVIETDAEVLLKEEFPEINAVAVFGGDKVDPPRFGKMFVSVDLSDVDGLPDSKKTEYTNFIRRRCNLSIQPILIEPEFTYIDISGIVRYNVSVSDLSPENINSLVLQTITDYNDDFLNNFNVTLRYSSLVDLIGDTDPSIVSNITTVKLYKKLQPDLLSHDNLVVNFATKLKDSFSLAGVTRYSTNDETTLSSSIFRYNNQAAILADDGAGVVRIVKSDGGFFTKIGDIGTIDYETGKINLNNFFINDYDGNSLLIYVKPYDLDITAAQNTILGIEPDRINLDIEILNL